MKQIKEDLSVFLKKYKTINYKKGQILVRPGDTFDKVIIEKDGFARVYKINDEGKEISWPILNPMEIYSWMTQFGGGKSEYYVETVTKMEAWVIPIDDFKKFLEKGNKDDFYLPKINTLAEILAKTEKLILADAYTKVAILLASLANEFGKKNGKEVMIDFNIPHRVWASITGLTRETVTLQILKMQNQGILENQKRKILIKDINKLK